MQAELMHYGVSGMRWYHRYHQSYDVVPTRSGKVGEEHFDPVDVRVAAKAQKLDSVKGAALGVACGAVGIGMLTTGNLAIGAELTVIGAASLGAAALERYSLHKGIIDTKWLRKAKAHRLVREAQDAKSVFTRDREAKLQKKKNKELEKKVKLLKKELEEFSEVSPTRREIENILKKYEEQSVTMDAFSGEYLAHYGTAGMKWYHRWFQSYNTVPTRSGKVGEEHGEAAESSAKPRLSMSEKLAEKRRKKILNDPRLLRKHADEFTASEINEAVSKFNAIDKLKTTRHLSKRRKSILKDPNRLSQNMYAFTPEEVEAALKRYDQEKRLDEARRNRVDRPRKWLEVGYEYVNLAAKYRKVAKTLLYGDEKKKKKEE